MDDVCCTAFRKLGHQPRIGYTIIPPDRPGYWWSHVKSQHPAGWWQTSGQIFISFPWFYGNSHVIPKICSHEFLATNRCERNGKSLDISNPWLPCEIFRNPWWNLHVRRIFLRKTQHIFRSSACPASNFSSGELRWEAQATAVSMQKWGTNWSSTGFNHENRDLKHEDFEGIRRIQDISEYHWWMMVDD